MVSSLGFLFFLSLTSKAAGNLEKSTDADNKSPNKALLSLDKGPALNELLDSNLSPLTDAVEKLGPHTHPRLSGEPRFPCLIGYNGVFQPLAEDVLEKSESLDF